MRKALAVLAVLVSVAACGADEDDPEVLEADAERVCKEWVADRLRSPGTAEFVDVSTTTGQADLTEQDVYDGKVDEGVFTVRGEVDSENGFGALLRSSWVCEVEDAGDTWRLLDIQLE